MPAYQGALDSIASLGGVAGCALVEVGSGMVVAHSAAEPLEAAFEAATDYWRLASRQGDRGHLGPPRAQVVIHANRRLTVAPAASGLILVTISQEPDRVPWDRWKMLVGTIASAVAIVWR